MGRSILSRGCSSGLKHEVRRRKTEALFVLKTNAWKSALVQSTDVHVSGFEMHIDATRRVVGRVFRLQIRRRTQYIKAYPVCQRRSEPLIKSEGNRFLAGSHID